LSLSLQSWKWCLRSSSSVVSSEEQKLKTQNKTKQHKAKNKKNPESVPSSNAIVSVSFSACRCSLVIVSSKGERKKNVVWLLSHQREKEKKKSLETVL
jgi:hypothetical protein